MNSLTIRNLDEIEKDAIRAKIGNGICTKHTGKMTGFWSFSTSVLLNDRCQARANSGNPDCICSHCYAQAQLKRYKNMHGKLAKNHALMNTAVYPVDAFPFINANKFRLESFGDIASPICAANYMQFARRNPETTFALWTKNPDYIAAAVSAGFEKPDNLIVIYSSPIIGKAATAEFLAAFPFVDKTFTVYRNEAQAVSAGVKINCGGRKCAECMACYNQGGDPARSELLK